MFTGGQHWSFVFVSNRSCYRCSALIARIARKIGVAGMTARRFAMVPLIGLLVMLAACGPLADDGESETAQDIELGEQLYEKHCETCHGGETGGDFEDVPPPHNQNGHTWHHADCENLRMIMEGNPESWQQRLIEEGFPEDEVVMPAFEGTLSEDEARAILNFIETWWTEEQREHQQQRTEEMC
jgi:mono/diheme cytochrome c family protein